MTQSANQTGRDTPDASAASDRQGAERPLSETSMGDKDSGGLAGQGGMRDPDKTSDPDPRKPS